MIRLTWRQFRAPAAAALGALVAVAIVLALTGPHLVHLYDTTVATCAAHGDCPSAMMTFLRDDNKLRMGLGLLVIVAPAIIGIFWGAPLATREIEAGTFPLVWTQSVTRTRWLAVKLGVIGLASMAVAGLLSLMLTWWASPLDRVAMSQFGPFDQRDIAPIGYAAFAFALGVTAGVLIRRTVPAMATTLVAFVAVRLAATSWLRPLLITPLHRYLTLNPVSTGYGSSVSGLSFFGMLFGGPPPSTLQPSTPDMPNTWIYSIQIADRRGHLLTGRVLNDTCPGIGTNRPGPAGGPSHSQVPAAVQQAMHDCVAKVGATYREVVTYQPAGRYWAFQWYELAIFLGAALILGGCCLYGIRRLS